MDFTPIVDLIDNLIEYENSDQTAPPYKKTDVNRRWCCRYYRSCPN